MIPKAAMRRLGLWLVGLFFIAQVCAVIPLLSEHTSHLAEAQLALSKHDGAGSATHRSHHRGDADGAIQHHELQDLQGAPACLFVSCGLSFAHVTITVYVSDSFPQGQPVLLERPPKSSLPV
jgi:hypothetical protein